MPHAAPEQPDDQAFSSACGGAGSLALAVYMVKEGADEAGSYERFFNILRDIAIHPDQMRWTVWVTVGIWLFLVLTGIAMLHEGLKGPVKMSRSATRAASDLILGSIVGLMLFKEVFLPVSWEQYWPFNREANFFIHCIYIYLLVICITSLYFWFDRKPKPPRPNDDGLFGGPGQWPQG